MMLQTIKSYIADLPNINFDAYYVQHILAVQDHQINYEFQFLINHNDLTLSNLDKLVDITLRELISK